MKTTVNARGETVVPAKIRRAHGIEPRTKLEWIDNGYTIWVIPVPADDPIGSAKGTYRGLGARLLNERERERVRS